MHVFAPRISAKRVPGKQLRVVRPLPPSPAEVLQLQRRRAVHAAVALSQQVGTRMDVYGSKPFISIQSVVDEANRELVPGARSGALLEKVTSAHSFCCGISLSSQKRIFAAKPSRQRPSQIAVETTYCSTKS